MTTKIEELDLRGVTSGGLECLIELSDGYGRRKPWIKCWSLAIRGPSGDRNLWWDAESKLEVYDFEHDLCKAFTLPLLGVTFKGSYWSRILFAAAIDPTRPDSFRVPAPGYDPGKTHGKPCETCSGEEPHLMVPEGFYLPDHDPELFAAVVGSQVEINLFAREPEE